MSALVLKRKKPRFTHELNAIVGVTLREITIWVKNPAMIIMSFALPLIMMGMIGGNVMGIAGAENLGTAMLVGMMVNMLFMVTAFGMISLVEESDDDFNQEMLVAPISRYSLIIGKIFGSSFSAIIAMMGTLIVGLIMGFTLPIGQLLLILALSPLMCFAGGALIMILIGVIKNPRTANTAVMLIIMPQMFLSGAIIPINQSNWVLLALSRVMPMTYCIDLARAITNIGEPMFDMRINFAAITIITLVCLVIGTFLFARSEKYR